MNGRSWRPLCQGTGEPVEWREDFLFEYWDFRPVLPSQLAVRSEKYKLITYQDFPESELYDLEKDPQENHNVAHEQGYAEVMADMENRLQRLVGETGWKQRRFRPVNNCYALGPLQEEEVETVRKMVFSREFNPSQEFDYRGTRLAWQKIGFESDGALDIGGTIPGSPGQVMLLSIPLKRLAERDPHAILDMHPVRETRAWYRNELIWECKAGASLGLSYYNFPLVEKTHVIQLEMSCEGPQKIYLTINAPEGSLSLL